MSKSKWIKSGPHKGKRSPYGGPAKTARGTVGMLPMNDAMRYWSANGGKSIRHLVRLFIGASVDRPPRGMQGGE